MAGKQAKILSGGRRLPGVCQSAIADAPQPGDARRQTPKAVLCPVSRSEQNNASALHDQRAQIAIPALADASEDRPIARRRLFRHQTEPSGKLVLRPLVGRAKLSKVSADRGPEPIKSLR